MKRRTFVRNTLALGVLSSVAGNNLFANAINNSANEEFSLPPLSYAYDGLEPMFDRKTMEIHYSKHHQAYVNNLNKALVGVEKKWSNVADICKNKKLLKNDTIRNNAGGHYNHSLFWELLKPTPASAPSGDLAKAIDVNFGSLENMKTLFNEAATKRFGSGWAWLVKTKDGKLTIGSTPNQDNPLMPISPFKGTPILALDVWEHAYYLKYQNKRKDYIDAWWNLVNWEKANLLFLDK